jgi:hypothetical protein
MEDVEKQQDLAELAAQSIADLELDGIDVWIERYLAPGFVWDVEPMGLGVRCEGAAAFHEFVDEWTGAYSDWFLEAEEVRALNDEVVVLRMRQGGRPHGSDQSVELRYAAVSLWRDRRCEATINYTSFDDALAAGQEMVRTTLP